MIVAEADGQYRLTTQPDHAFLAGEILSLWRADALAKDERRDAVLFAAREHDNGWREADAAPRCDADGRPMDFRRMPPDDRMALWDRGTLRWSEQHGYAAALIARHARWLHRDRRTDALWRPFLLRVAQRERCLRQQSAAAPRDFLRHYRLLANVDRISLAACSGAGGDLRLEGMRGRLRPGGVVQLSPMPLAGATTFRVACRTIAQRVFRGDADLGGSLAAARWQQMQVRLTDWDEV